MDDLAPAPAQRPSDDGGLRPEAIFSPRKKAAKKPSAAPLKDGDPENEPDHQLDVQA